MLKYVFSRPFLPVESVISLLVAEDGSCIEQGGKTIFPTHDGKNSVWIPERTVNLFIC